MEMLANESPREAILRGANKPSRTEVQVDSIPASMKGERRWVCWKYKRRNGKWEKMPFTPTGDSAKSNDPHTWCGFDEAHEAYLGSRSFAGIGFVLGDGWAGVDLDSCRNPDTAEIDEPAASIIDGMHSYSEISPTGTGIKILVRGSLPPGRRKNEKLDIECYDSGRYFTVTGQSLPNRPDNPEERTQELDWLFGAYLSTEAEHWSGGAGSRPADDVEVAREALARIPASYAACYTDWIRVGLAARNVSESLFDDWVAFSQKATDKFSSVQECATKWKSFAARTGGVGIGTLVFLAKESGWQPSGGVVADSPQNTGSRRRSLANFREHQITQANGKPKKVRVPLTASEMASEVLDIYENWPRAVGNLLFVHHPGGDRIEYLPKPDHLFGWLRDRHRVDLASGECFLSKGEIASSLPRHVAKYEAIETSPHFPPVQGHYYTCNQPSPTGGEHLRKLRDFFTFETPIDSHLFVAAVATVFWGGPPGARPAFLVTSDHGQGSGKSKVVQIISHLVGGSIEVEPKENARDLKKRFLSPEALSTRVVSIDNVKTIKLTSADIEALITASVISGHQMYTGEANRPNRMVWFCTMNGASLSRDMAQRFVEIRLGKPTYSGTWLDQVLRFVDDHRSDIISDVAGLFDAPAASLTCNSRWGSWERAVLSRLPSPADAQTLIASRSKLVDADQEDGRTVAEYVQEQLERCGYNPAEDVVHIPSSIAAAWVQNALGDRTSIKGSSATLERLHRSGSLPEITKNPSRKHGRGFLWGDASPKKASPNASPEASPQAVSYDLEKHVNRWGEPYA